MANQTLSRYRRTVMFAVAESAGRAMNSANSGMPLMEEFITINKGESSPGQSRSSRTASPYGPAPTQ
jgi:hypothetical protein